METTETTKGETFNYQGHDYDVVEVHIRFIKAGDTVLHDGKLQTVSSNNMSFDQLMGRAIFGDCYKSGHQLVKKVIM